MQVVWAPFGGWHAIYGYAEGGTPSWGAGVGVIFNISDPCEYKGVFINQGYAMSTPYGGIGGSVSFTPELFEKPYSFLYTWGTPGYTSQIQYYFLLYTDYDD